MEGIAKVEAEPKLDNRNMIMVLAPDKRARQAAQSRASNQERADRKATATAKAGGGSESPTGPAAAEANGTAPPVGDDTEVSEVAASAEEG